MELAKKHVLITGAGRRIGRHLAERLIPFDVRLSAHYFRSQREARELEVHPSVHTIAADLSDVASLRRLVDTAEARFGPVDILIQSASLFYPTPARACTEAQWDELMAANVRGQFFLSQACAKNMPRPGGVILHLGESCVPRSMKNFTAYLAAKAALLATTRNLAKEWAPGIRVNSVSPGPILPPESYSAEQKFRAGERTLLRRWGSPEDIAQAVLFLIGNDYITGFDLVVDGGRSIAK